MAVATPVPLALAHPAISASALIKVGRDGRIVVMVSHDALAFALDDIPRNVTDAAMFELLDGPDAELATAFSAARDRFAALFELLADDRRQNVQLVEFPTAASVREFQRANPTTRLPVRLGIEAHGRYQAATRGVAIRFPDVLGDVILTVDPPFGEPYSLPLNAGETSPTIDVRPPDSSGPGAAATVVTRTSTSMSGLRVAARYAKLGFVHIIPEGTDHALFVLGLFLLSPRFKTVLWQITAFTIAHTITLTLTSLNVIGLPARFVEVSIALSIAFIGVENLFTTRVHAWRPAVAFLFGLVHGMGVASSFNEAGFPEGQLVPALAAFTVGVEGGHMTVLALAFLALGWWRDKPWYRQRVAVPISVAIALMAGYWTIKRLGWIG